MVIVSTGAVCPSDMTAEHRKSIAKQAALRVIDVQSALRAVLENGVVVFTFAFLSRECQAAGVS
jgi:hypothetical protein